jgi:hypothetical protein
LIISSKTSEMKKLIFLFSVCLLSVTVFGQLVIKPEDAAKHVGEKVTVCGKIYSGKFLENAKKQPTFLNMGDKFPNQPLTVVIWGDLRSKLSYKPEERYADQYVCVTGTIVLYKEKAQIEVTEETQLKFQVL